jgi:hypothetical protein
MDEVDEVDKMDETQETPGNAELPAEEAQDEEFAQEQALISQGYAEQVSAQTVEMRQAGARSIRARQVVLRQGGAVSVDADSVEVQQGAVGLVRAGEAHLGLGTRSGAILADSVSVDQGMAQVIMTRDSADVRQSMVGLMVGQHINANNSPTAVMIADSVEGGNPGIVLNRGSAMVFGAALGAGMALMMFMLSMFRRRS